MRNLLLVPRSCALRLIITWESLPFDITDEALVLITCCLELHDNWLNIIGNYSPPSHWRIRNLR